MNSQELRPFTITVGKYNITVVPENISVQIESYCSWALNSAEVRSFIEEHKPFWLFWNNLSPELSFDNETKYYALIKFNITEFWQLNVWRELNETTGNYTIKTKLFSNINETKFNIKNILLAAVTYLDENGYNFARMSNFVLTALPQFSPVVLILMRNACYGSLIYLTLNGAVVDFDVVKLVCYDGSWQKRWFMFIGNLIFFSIVLGPIFLIISLAYIIHRYAKKKTKTNRTTNMA
ncbi:MAG: hypothetical protein ACP6IU_14270 [Candidatus Asgardarchaeia archaeon]